MVLQKDVKIELINTIKERENLLEKTGLDYLIIDALRRTPHPSHTHLDKTLKWIEELKPNNAILTNMHIDMDYETLCQETAENIQPAFDGMTIELDY